MVMKDSDYTTVMNCPECGRVMEVYDTTKAEIGGDLITLRRRKCPDHKQYRCGTIERVAKTDEDFALMKILSAHR